MSPCPQSLRSRLRPRSCSPRPRGLGLLRVGGSALGAQTPVPGLCSRGSALRLFLPSLCRPASPQDEPSGVPVQPPSRPQAPASPRAGARLRSWAGREAAAAVGIVLGQWPVLEIEPAFC